MAGGRLVFASELKSILEVNEIGRDINWRSFNHLLTFLATPRDESIIEGVRKLEPGCLLTASRERGVRTESYWDLSFAAESGDEDYFAGRLRELLEESVRLHLASDVPLGAFLSGGIDSSAVVATMARLTPAPVKTFSIGFGERDYDELAHARVVAKEFGTEHHELVLQPDVLDSIEDLAWHLDEPFGDSSAIPTYMVSKLAAEHVTVILSGDGGDELFGGYDKYAVEERERAWRLPGALRWLLGAIGRSMPYGMKGRNFARHFSLSGWERYLDALVLFRQEEKRELLTREAYETLRTDDPLRGGLEFLARGENGHWLSSAQYFDFMSYLPLDILTKVDRMSMAHSLEARVPLLDHRLIEFAATIPPELLLREGATKRVFKRAMRGILPDPIIDRRKQGFAIPLGRWFGGKLGSFVRELLLSRRSRARGVLNPAYVEKLLKLNESGRPLDLHLWTLMSFELWCRAFLDGGPRRSVTSSRSVAVWNRGRSGAGVLRPAARPRLAAT
jgi:asparagine synthase (glutamine-hydrolysing)